MMKNYLVIFIGIFSVACSRPKENKLISDTSSVINDSNSSGTQSVQANEMGDSSLSGVLNIDRHQVQFTPIEETEYKKFFKPADKNDDDNCDEFPDDCEAGLDNYYAQKFPGVATRSGQTLSVKIKNGKVDFTNVTSEDGGVEYHYRGQLPSGFHIIQEMYLEGRAFSLVNINTGEKTKIWGYPVESPDKNRILVYSMDLVAGFYNNGLQLFKIDNGKIAKEWEKEFYSWGPGKPYWKDNQTLNLLQGKQREGEIVFTYATMKIYR